MDKDIISGEAVLKSQGGFSPCLSRCCVYVACQPLGCVLLFLYVVSTVKSPLQLSNHTKAFFFPFWKKRKKGYGYFSAQNMESSRQFWFHGYGHTAMQTNSAEKKADKLAIRSHRPETV